MSDKKKSYTGSYTKLPEEKRDAALAAATALYAHSIRWQMTESDLSGGMSGQKDYSEVMDKSPISLRREKDFRNVMNKELKVPKEIQDAALDILDSYSETPKTIVLQQISRIEGSPVVRRHVITASDSGEVEIVPNKDLSNEEEGFIKRLERIEERLGIASQDISADIALSKSSSIKSERKIRKEVLEMLKKVSESYQELPDDKKVSKVDKNEPDLANAVAFLASNIFDGQHVQLFDSGQLNSPKLTAPGAIRNTGLDGIS